MGDEKLAELLERASPKEASAWLRRQQAAARKLLGNLAAMSGNSGVVAEISDYTVVGETIANIRNGHPKFEWNGEDDFDRFFFRCMTKSINIISSENKRKKFISPLPLDHPVVMKVAQEPPPAYSAKKAQSEEEIIPALLERAFRERRLREGSSTAEYLKQLDVFADAKYDAEHIRRILGIAQSSYRQIRGRVARLIVELDKDDV